MDLLLGKKVLFFATSGYSDGIVKKMRDLGLVVDYYNDKPNDGFISKACGRYQIKAYEIISNRYYKKIIETKKNEKYDFIFVICGENTPVKSLALLKENFPDAKMILYMWDSVANKRNIDKKWKFFDKVYTFDRKDYLANKDRLEFLPLFYYEDYLPEKDVKNEYDYDVSFIGTGHEDRIKIVKAVKRQCEEARLSFYSYIFLPHKLVYLYNKLRNKHFKDVTKKDVCFEKVPFKTTYAIYAGSKCVMDVESSTQTGLTMRTIEMIGLKKKLITTNKDIVNYDFYNENNIMVVDRMDFKIDKEFFNKPYVELNSGIYERYSLTGWIKNVLR